MEVTLPRLTDATISHARLEMAGPGFALIGTPSFFDGELGNRLRRCRTTLRYHDKRWRRFPQLARYGCWLEELLSRAMPDEGVALTALEFRREPAGSIDEEVDRLHADGGYVRTVFTLFGQASIYRDRGTEQPVPGGQTLLMTAMDRARAVGAPCTLHRRPGAGPERAVIVCSFNPCRDRPPVTNVYREVATPYHCRSKLRGGRRNRP